MIIEYQRPQTLAEALTLLARATPVSLPLGGGTFLNRRSTEQIAVIDLQNLGLGNVSIAGNQAEIGATATLQRIFDFPGFPHAIYKSLQLEQTYNLRQMASLAGTLVTATGRSPLATVLLAADASLEIQEPETSPKLVKLGDWLPIRAQRKPRQLITRITFPINIQLGYEYIARTAADQPIVCAATAQWNSGRTRLALGGWGNAPVLAMDGPEAAGIETAGRSAYSHAEDEWASAEYRQEMAAVLALRCLQQNIEGK